ncbi:GNAT family N-acetyltransferase [Enterovibrio coralii]|uniref:N-acetyltransferase domain-containing protein n=1 Tax=Enterovibrio coralii TaxID=294935 RepID=A0A135I699_9GAMM|nr:GNAT family N-acetyltransferase [Enterovibrio coralii]KXF80980.1 hypothetical protein ATN88_18210 [Enterovibrio coralii]
MTEANKALHLRPSKGNEFLRFSEMEASQDTCQMIIPYTAEKHKSESEKPGVIYLSILVDNTLSGFFILALDGDSSVEFKRIVIADKGKGIGQLAIRAMEAYCKDTLHKARIWLDVFEDNARGQHIYAKLGYQPFSTSSFEGRTLLLMEKSL